MIRKTSLLPVSVLLLAVLNAHAAIGEPAFISFAHTPRSVALVQENKATALWLDSADYPGVLRAAGDAQTDIERASAVRPELHVGAATPQGSVVWVAGTLGRNRFIDGLVRKGKLDVGAIQGKWEAFLIEVVARPAPGIERAIIVAGSDQRGTVYGLYEISQQIGVSPWHWWADVPVPRHKDLFVRAGRYVNTGPAVKYRGIFLNDEAPALQSWAEEKFGGVNHKFYAHVFELILRLRGNYLWPAMWGNALIDDDPRSAPLAAEYGIVLGTSHHEPMMRAHDEWRRYGSGAWDYAKNEERLREFWRGGVERVKENEKIVTVGMRGDGDEAMSEETNVALLTKIVADQRGILKDVLGRESQEIPQLWALYKEVQDYYERGMRVPDDVTLLWCDDNWGNIRRLPTPSERGRAGGAGVYYHFDYVGGPRNYKWLNTVPITKVWEQMNLAAAYGADRIWIVNVGDLKPMEFPIEFFLTMAWDPGRWSADTLDEYSVAWATREFGPRHAREIAALINGYTKLNGRRKPEMLAPDTLSLMNYREADRVMEVWRGLVQRAEHIYAELPVEMRAAFFQLVLYPVKASAGIQELYIAAGRNRWYASQGRVSANAEAARVRALFAADGALARQYHELNGGKWNHMMSQVKMGYTTWQQPNAEVMPAVSEVRPRAGASMAISIEGSTTAWPSYRAGDAGLPPLDVFARGTRRIELFNRGDRPFRFTVKSDQPWITISQPSGSVSDSLYMEIGAQWSDVPPGTTQATLTIQADTGSSINVRLPVHNPSTLPPRTFKGFIESDRHVAIEAPRYSRAVNESGTARGPTLEGLNRSTLLDSTKPAVTYHASVSSPTVPITGLAAAAQSYAKEDGVTWRTLPGFGRTLGGVTVYPVTATTREVTPRSPRLEYDVYLYSTGELQVDVDLAPSLDFQSGDGLRFAISFDDAPPQLVKLNTWSRENWSRAVADGIRRVSTKHRITNPAPHVLKFWMITPGVVLERIVINAGGVRESYLGPPESPRATPTREHRRAP